MPRTRATSSSSSAAGLTPRWPPALMGRTLALSRAGWPSTPGVRACPRSGSVLSNSAFVAGPTTDQLAALHEAVHEEASSRVWSQGVTMCRDDRVTGRSSSDAEVVLDVRLPGRPVRFTVVLYPGDGEWDCDCGGREAVCSHVVAAVLATEQAQAAGAALPTSRKAGATLRYRLKPQAGGLALTRLALGADGSETRIEAQLPSILAGRVPGP